MKQFFKALLACLLALFIFTLLGVFILIGIGMSGDASPDIKDGSILHLKMDAPIVDRASDNPLEGFDFMSFSANPQIGLNDVLNSIRAAKTDEKIKGIYLESSMIQAGMASVEEMRDALLDFKTSGKFTIAYSEMYSQKDYYLASACDKVYLFPQGYMEFTGLNKTVVFLKGTLEKLGVEMQIIRHGKFKSAIEPLVLDKMSEANKEQSMTYVSDLWMQMVEGISKSRKISSKELLAIAEEFKIQKPKDALMLKMVDGLKYQDEITAELKSLCETKDKDKLEMVSASTYAKAIKPIQSIEKIAVIYASGDIVSGKGAEGEMGSETIRKQIEKAREDEDVKAIVLRVNSPGGSALASDVIWREVVLAKKVKPVVVSMGDVAASGGYYIACAANEVFASENTITGSIGVFGVIPNMKKLLEDKIGLSFDGVKTNEYADLGSLYRPLKESERAIIQNSVEGIYEDFITKVGEGRNLSKADVDSIGQGRVWSGQDAKDIKLVDQFGGLQKAIERAAVLAKMEKYALLELPVQKDPFEAILEGLSGQETEAKILKEKLGISYSYFEILHRMSKMEGTQARLPFEFVIE